MAGNSGFAQDLKGELNPPARLELQDVTSAGRRTLRLKGEVDLASAPLLADALGRVGSDGIDSVVIDLSGLTFIDSTGLRAILAGKERLIESGCEMLFVPGPPQVQRLFTVTGLLDVLSFTPAADAG